MYPPASISSSFPGFPIVDSHVGLDTFVIPSKRVSAEFISNHLAIESCHWVSVIMASDDEMSEAVNVLVISWGELSWNRFEGILVTEGSNVPHEVMVSEHWWRCCVDEHVGSKVFAAGVGVAAVV